MLKPIYTILFYLAIPFILLRLLWRSRHIMDYRQRWLERFGFFAITEQWQQGIWVHTVSLGEVVAATPLIKAIQKQYPQLPITITTMTITGSQRVRKNFDERVFHVYVPYDLPTATARFLRKLQPKVGIIFETELWPNLLAACRHRQIPMMLANARLSKRSANGYQRIAKITRQMLSSFQVIAAHAKADGQRFIELGADAKCVSVTGSIKFETNVPVSVFEQAEVIRDLWGRSRPIWVVASTHDGEEAKILQVFKQLLRELPQTLLVLVPRHPERFSDVIRLCREKGYRSVTRSSRQACDEKTQVFIGDTMGELNLFYAACDVAFVGGSLVGVGGHNVLEPISLGKPCITGPHMFNFTEITDSLLQADALIQVQNAEQLLDMVKQLLQDSHARAQMSERALQVFETNKGALGRNMALLNELLSFCLSS